MTESNTVELNKGAYTPKYILNQALEKADDYECLAIVFKTKSGLLGSVTSNMLADELALLSKKLDLRVFNMLAGASQG